MIKAKEVLEKDGDGWTFGEHFHTVMVELGVEAAKYETEMSGFNGDVALLGK